MEITAQAGHRRPRHPQHPHGKARTAMSARAPRTRRLLAATALALLALTVTGCKDGTGVRDEGPATGHAQPLRHPVPEHAKRPSGREHRPDGLEAR
ncbi:hypothetical protein ACIGDI_43255 [Streptomyces sp. NPDC085900]|uniref:hypothetical protein n=1 Tax=unclassified Streptomyces TaxID=2593676 RepID=UPI00190C8827|nr:hypothetical protein [Streptomyces sp. MBT33]MBK3647299.1 hypothetical protein [Streptomyces sp. MBT33]